MALTNMENAAKPAVEDLVVRVWGMNAKGKAFSQNAYARNLALDGALLSGVDHFLALGDTIGVQYQDKKCRFKVITSRDAGLPHKVQVSLGGAGSYQTCHTRHSYPKDQQETTL